MKFASITSAVVISYVLTIYSLIQSLSDITIDAILSIIKNTSKEFRLEASFHCDIPTIKKFINKFVDKGNTIVKDGWNSYNYLDNADSGYIHIKHLHNAGSFRMGLQSTSHIESI